MTVYLLLRAHDTGGPGWLDVDTARELLTSEGSPWCIVGWRRLRQILAAGDGIFWNRDDRRVWLMSPDKTATALGCGRLRGYPVMLPIKPLLAGIKSIRRHFYAAYDSGRRSENPISLASLAGITGVSVRSQTTYNQELKRRTQRTSEITDLPYTHENIYERSRQNNAPVFPFKDWEGRRGEAGTTYCANRIADTRQRMHKQAPKGRLRKINRKIDPVIKPQRGNSRTVNVTYHPDEFAAAKASCRDSSINRRYPDKPRFQPNASRRSKWQGTRFYRVITAC